MTTIPGSVRVTGFIAPSDSTDPYATHEDTYGKGGFRPVADTTARDAIPADRRKIGMWVKVIDIDKVYTLSGGITNGDWVEQTMGDSGAINSPLTMYVDGATGDDANDGLAWGTAKKTLGILVAGQPDALPREINAAVAINIRNDIRARSNSVPPLSIRNFYGSGSITLTGVLTSVETFTASTYENDLSVRKSRLWITDGTKSWTSNQWRRHFVDIGAGRIYPVRGNTGTKLNLCSILPITGTPAGTIYSAPEILTEVVTNPGTKYDFAHPGSCNIRQNTIPIFINNLWLDEYSYADSMLEVVRCSRVELVCIASSDLLLESCDVVMITSCYADLTGFKYSIFEHTCVEIFYSVIDSTDSSGYGIYFNGEVLLRLYNTWIGNQITGYWLGAGSQIWLYSGAYLENITDGILLFDATLHYEDGGVNAIRFDTVVRAFSGSGNIIVSQGPEFLGWDVTQEIAFSAVDTGTFAELDADTLSSRGNISITYLDADYRAVVPPEYDNTLSGLTAIRYQTAIDELAAAGGGGVNVATFAETTIDLVDDTDFTIVEAVPYVTEGVGYQLSVTPTTAVGLLTVILYQDVARLEPIYTLVVDLSDADTYWTVEAFGFELETAGTIYGTAFVSGVGVGETFDISLTAIGVQPSAAPAPLPSPYGDGIEDDGLGKPRVAFPSDGGFAFALGKLKIKPDTTAAVYPTLAVGGVAITGAVTTTTDENISAKKLFTAIGSGRLGASGPPAAGTYLVGHEILDSDGIKYRCTVAGTPGTWELADSVSDAQADYSTAALAPGVSEVLEILTTGNVGTVQLLQVWAVIMDTANYSTDFRLRVYRTSDGYGRDVMWQASGVARQSYLGAILPAAQDYIEVNDEDMFDTDEACVVYEDDNRYELARILARSAGSMDLNEILVDASSWAIEDTVVCSVAEFENVPFRNTDTTPANQNRVFLQVRNNHAVNTAIFYVRAWPLSLGVLR